MSSQDPDVTRGSHYVIAADTWKPWFLVEENTNGTLEYSGIMWEVLQHLSSSLNFTYTMVRPPDGKWGTVEVNGSWNGMMGMLHRKEVDFALGPFALTQEREEICDFSVPLMIDGYTIFMPAPNVKNDPLVLIRPFDIYTWTGIFLSLCTVIVTYTTMDIFFGVDIQFTKLCSFVARVLFSEPPNWTPSHYNYHKVMSIVTMLSLFILVQSYSGTLVSMFTAPSFQVPINSLEDLVNQNELPWAIETGTIMEDFTRSAVPGTNFRKLYDGAMMTGLCSANKEKIKSGEFAEICVLLDIFAIVSEDFSQTAQCNFVFPLDTFLSITLSMAFQEKSPLVNMVNAEITSLLEAGFQTKWISQHFPNATHCATFGDVKASKIAQRSSKLDLMEMRGTFLLAQIALSLAFLAFLLELWWSKISLAKRSSLNCYALNCGGTKHNILP